MDMIAEAVDKCRKLSDPIHSHPALHASGKETNLLQKLFRHCLICHSIKSSIISVAGFLSYGFTSIGFPSSSKTIFVSGKSKSIAPRFPRFCLINSDNSFIIHIIGTNLHTHEAPAHLTLIQRKLCCNSSSVNTDHRLCNLMGNHLPFQRDRHDTGQSKTLFPALSEQTPFDKCAEASGQPCQPNRRLFHVPTLLCRGAFS